MTKKGYSIDSELKGAIGDRRVKNRVWRLARKRREENEVALVREEYIEARKK